MFFNDKLFYNDTRHISGQMNKKDQDSLLKLKNEIIKIISETGGIPLQDTIGLLLSSKSVEENKEIFRLVEEFNNLLSYFKNNKINVRSLLDHPFSKALFLFLKEFPLLYHEEHIHLTGSLSAAFIYPRIKKLLSGKNKKIYEKQILAIYGPDALPINSIEDVDKLIRLKDGDMFATYLKILFLPKMILTDRKNHTEAAYHMASELYSKYNTGNIRLKFTLNRVTNIAEEQIPGMEKIRDEDVILGLYEGFMKFKEQEPLFNFILSPCFRKEVNFYDSGKFASKEAHINNQVDRILQLRKKHPYLEDIVREVDTVGDEKDFYRKKHFEQMKDGLRRLQYSGFLIKSHHGEAWKTLKQGVQSVDNAMNIWHIDALEHGLSLGINPHCYFHRIYQKVMELNQSGTGISKRSSDYEEIKEMDWEDLTVRDKILQGTKLTKEEEMVFTKTKFYTAREIEHYQHEILNRMLDKDITLIALPSSNLKLTGRFPDYKDHPFSWWEKKGVDLGVGTDNYITLNTNYIRELLILLYSDSENLKITKLLMIATKERRRPYISNLLWEMRTRVS